MKRWQGSCLAAFLVLLVCGGSLVFTEWRAGRTMGQYRLIPEQGMLVAFPSELTHEVMPVTYGERYSIVSWYG